MNTDIVGIFYLSGVHEMAAGFSIRDDHSFDFFFSYGALDRYGSGLWHLSDHHLILNSKPWSGSDFRLIDSYANHGKQVTFEFFSENSLLLQYIYVSIEGGRPDTWFQVGHNGLISLDKEVLSALWIGFEFSPERQSVIQNLNPAHNYFQFKPESWIFEFFFKDFKLKQGKSMFSCKFPFLGKQELVFTKR